MTLRSFGSCSISIGDKVIPVQNVEFATSTPAPTPRGLGPFALEFDLDVSAEEVHEFVKQLRDNWIARMTDEQRADWERRCKQLKEAYLAARYDAWIKWVREEYLPAWREWQQDKLAARQFAEVMRAEGAWVKASTWKPKPRSRKRGEVQA